MTIALEYLYKIIIIIVVKHDPVKNVFINSQIRDLMFWLNRKITQKVILFIR